LKNRTRWIAAALALACLPLAHAQTDDQGTWLVRGRALHLDSANKGIDGLSVDNKTFPELDITYFFDRNLAIELVLTYPQKHDVRLEGVGKIGSLKHLPPTLSLQYHFPQAGFRPYVGVGLNYTRFSSVDLPSGVSIDKNSTGLAVGAGVDIPFGGGWLFNVDLKKVQIRTDVSSGGESAKFKIDPLLFSLGVGKRF
jgi:outer membrane protein